ncbi:MAG: hypothetical protein QXV17_07455 [Candidatus Micrarchaeaceae archaeon]
MQCIVKDNDDMISIELTDQEEIKELIKNLRIYANKLKMHPEIFFNIIMKLFFESDLNTVEPDLNVINLLADNITFKITVKKPSAKINDFIASSIASIIDKIKSINYHYDGWGLSKGPVADLGIIRNFVEVTYIVN